MSSTTVLLVSVVVLVTGDIAPVYQQNTPNGNVVIGGGNTFDTNWKGYTNNYNGATGTLPNGFQQANYNNYNGASNNYNGAYNNYNTGIAYNQFGVPVANVGSTGYYNGNNYNGANAFAPTYNAQPTTYSPNTAYNGNGFAPNYNTVMPPGYATTWNGQYGNGPYGYLGPSAAARPRVTEDPKCAALRKQREAALRRQNTYNTNQGYNFNGFNNYGRYVPGGAWNTGFSNLASPTPAPGAASSSSTQTQTNALHYRPPANSMWNVVLGHGNYNGQIPGGGTAEQNACQVLATGPEPVPTVRWMGSSDSIFNGDFVVTHNPSADINHGAGGSVGAQSTAGSGGAGGADPNSNYYFTNYVDPYTGQPGITWSANNNWGNNGWTGGTPWVGDLSGSPPVWGGLSQNNNGYTGWGGGGGEWMNEGAWKFNGALGR